MSFILNKLAETTNKEKINLIFKSDLTKIFQCDMCHNDKIKTTKSSIYCMSLPVDRKCGLAAAIKQSNNAAASAISSHLIMYTVGLTLLLCNIL